MGPLYTSRLPMARDLDLHSLTILDDAVPADLDAFERAEARQQDQARREALEVQAQACDNAADACWYLARSLGAARDLPPGEASLELLFQLIGALADLPSEVALAPLPEIDGARDDGITELCHQLAVARETAEDALIDAELAAPRAAFAH
jgi:hypothetical protein